MTKILLTDYIPAGNENRIKSRELEALTGLKGTEIRAAVNTFRANGTPIVSDEKGYYMATTAEEIDKAIRSLGGRINAIKRARNGLIIAKHKFFSDECKNEGRNDDRR